MSTSPFRTFFLHPRLKPTEFASLMYRLYPLFWLSISWFMALISLVSALFLFRHFLNTLLAVRSRFEILRSIRSIRTSIQSRTFEKSFASFLLSFVLDDFVSDVFVEAEFAPPWNFNELPPAPALALPCANALPLLFVYPLDRISFVCWWLNTISFFFRLTISAPFLPTVKKRFPLTTSSSPNSPVRARMSFCSPTVPFAYAVPKIPSLNFAEWINGLPFTRPLPVFFWLLGAPSDVPPFAPPETFAWTLILNLSFESAASMLDFNSSVFASILMYPVFEFT